MVYQKVIRIDSSLEYNLEKFSSLLRIYLMAKKGAKAVNTKSGHFSQAHQKITLEARLYGQEEVKIELEKEPLKNRFIITSEQDLAKIFTDIRILRENAIYTEAEIDQLINEYKPLVPEYQSSH